METAENLPISTSAILDFWFLAPTAVGYGQARAEWFRKSDAFDAEIRQRFAPAIEQCIALGELSVEQHAALSVEQALARIILLDQMTRNAYRDTARAFAGDALALSGSLALLASGRDLQLGAVQRWFAYLPLEHAEDLPLQERSVALFAQLAKEQPYLRSAYEYAVKHRNVIARFGRFPHRNQILGRCSSTEELEFLKQPGSRF